MNCICKHFGVANLNKSSLSYIGKITKFTLVYKNQNILT